MTTKVPYPGVGRLFPLFGILESQQLADWILEKILVRVQLQIHKYIWDPDARGV